MIDEKFEEKEMEKREEKSFDEKHRRDPIGSISWAAFLIWAGVVLLLNNTGNLHFLTAFVDRLNLPKSDLPFTLPFVDMAAWQVFFLGAGVIVLIEVLVRLVVPMYRKPIIGSIIWAAVLFGLALGNWTLIGPLVVIAIGLAILIGGIFRKR